MKIEIQAVHTVKPSSPTPDHLRHHTLSFIDQLAPPIYMPQVYFYPKDDTDYSTKRDILMYSLAIVLTRFYPLAGRAKDNHLYIECNDEGARFTEARVMCPLSSILENPIPGELNKLCPFVDVTDLNEISLAVQLNSFDCGGVAIGMSMSHKVADGLSFLTFVSSWAAISRGDPEKAVATPSFESATVFPPKPLSYFQHMSTGIVKEGTVAKRFFFDAKAINRLRTIFTDNDPAVHGDNRRSTRVEALSAFLWSRYMDSTQPEGGHPEKLYSILHAVNLRTRTDPPLSDRHFGNMSRVAISVPGPKAQGFDIVRGVREAIRQVNADYIKKLIDASEVHVNSMKQRSESIARGEVVPFSFTSLCRFPIYGSDFGWGKPVWVGLGTFPFRNLVAFVDANSGDGIEAYVYMKEEEMVMFEKDKELLIYVTGNSVKTIRNGA